VRGKIIFSNVGQRTMVSRTHHVGIAIMCLLMFFALLFFLPSIEGTKEKAFAGMIMCLDVVGLIFVLPWVPKFKANVTATDEGIGFGDQFYSWAEVTRMNSWFGGRIDVYVERDSTPSAFCFGVVLNSQEFWEGYKYAYSQLQNARETYRRNLNLTTNDRDKKND
jgi:hypothetical protein